MKRKTYSLYTPEEYKKEVAHRKVNKTLNRLDRLSGRVALGFLAYSVLYLTAWVAVVVYFF